MTASTLETWSDDAYGPFVDEPSGQIDDLVASLLDDRDTAREYLRSTFLADTMAELRRLRIGRGITQAELGELLGAHQSAIARMERRDDISLSKLWDYLYALGMTPFAMEWGSFEKVVECVRLDPGHRVTSDHFYGRFEPESSPEPPERFLDVVPSGINAAHRKPHQLDASNRVGTQTWWTTERFDVSENAHRHDKRVKDELESIAQRVSRDAVGYGPDGNRAKPLEVRRG